MKRIINAIGCPTIVGANIAAPEVIAAASDALSRNFEIDELQRAACHAIAAATGAEAGCVTSSASSGIAIAAAACMTGVDLARVARLPDTAGMRDELILHSPLSDEVLDSTNELRQFMFKNVYLAGPAKTEDEKAQRLLWELLRFFEKHPVRMPAEHQRIAERDGTKRAVADYIAGMTDRYALDTYTSLFIPSAWGTL